MIQARDKIVHLRLTAREYEIIAFRASAVGLSTSAYMRLCALAQGPIENPKVTPLDNTTNKSGTHD